MRFVKQPMLVLILSFLWSLSLISACSGGDGKKDGYIENNSEKSSEIFTSKSEKGGEPHLGGREGSLGERGGVEVSGDGGVLEFSHSESPIEGKGVPMEAIPEKMSADSVPETLPDIPIKPGQASSNGTISGITFKPQDAAFLPFTLGLVISDFNGLCAKFQKKSKPQPPFKILFVLIRKKLKSISPPITLDFQNKELSVKFAYKDKSGKEQEFEPTKGTLTITSISQRDGLKGKFNFTFGKDQISGSFTAPICFVR